MTRHPAIDFPFWSPESDRNWDSSVWLHELREERDRRRSYYPKRIVEGRMTEADAAEGLALIDAIIDEVAWLKSPRDRHVPDRKLPWARKLNNLRGEIMIRRNSFPKLVASGRLDARDAKHAIGALEAAHAWYWTNGIDFGAEFIIPGSPSRTRQRIREEVARRDAWERNGGWDLGADDIEIAFDDLSIRHTGPGPFHICDGSIFNAAGVAGMFSLQGQISAALDALDPRDRAQALAAIAAALTAEHARHQGVRPERKAA